MILGTDDVAVAIEVAKKQLEYASTVSFPAYSLTFVACAIVGVLGIHLLCFVRPDAKSRRDCNEKQAEAVLSFAQTHAKQTLLLEQHQSWHKEHDQRQSAIENMLSQYPCKWPPAGTPPKPAKA